MNIKFLSKSNLIVLQKQNIAEYLITKQKFTTYLLMIAMNLEDVED
jgi:hypothetical protein